MFRRILPGLLAVTGVVLVSAAAVLWLTSPPASPAAFGQVPGAAAPPAASPAPTASPTASPTAPSAAPSTAPRPVTATARQPRAVAPASVRLATHAPTRVVTIGTDANGRLDPPERVTDAGWWPGGAALGSAQGTVVLAGHVDSASQGIGAFARLRDLGPGDRVVIAGTDHRAVVYRVTGRRTYPRDHTLPAQIFARTGAPRLALITCTGRFDRSTAHYSDTLVVYAVPVARP